MKAKTNNNYQNAINRTIDYINTHISDEINIKKLANVACISVYHFHRIFKAHIGESAGAYITRIRLEKAALKLQTGNDLLSHIAEKTGYQTQHSLSKAFKKHFGISPTAFRKMNSYYSSQTEKPKYLKQTLEPKIILCNEKHLVYIRIIAKYGEQNKYTQAWKQLWKYAKQNQLITDYTESIGLSFDDPNITKAEQCRFYACITTNSTTKAHAEFGICTLPKGKFAVFTHKGSYSGLNDVYKFIYIDWLPQSGYTIRNSTPFEKYLNNPAKVPENEILTEIYIPIK